VKNRICFDINSGRIFTEGTNGCYFKVLHQTLPEGNETMEKW
jgi:hypothetical protein